MQRPSAVVRVTEHMDVIRDYISQIVGKGMAYRGDDGVYFDVGEFSKRWAFIQGRMCSSGISPEGPGLRVKHRSRQGYGLVTHHLRHSSLRCRPVTLVSCADSSMAS